MTVTIAERINELEQEISSLSSIYRTKADRIEYIAPLQRELRTLVIHRMNGRGDELVPQSEVRVAQAEVDTLAGYRYAPAGTTYANTRNGVGQCEQCGQIADWNSGAGQFLCSRHWDNY